MPKLGELVAASFLLAFVDFLYAEEKSINFDSNRSNDS
jgi:hypothetical protein